MATQAEPLVDLQKYYRHSDDKNEIGWKKSNDIYVVGPVLQSVFSMLGSHGLAQRGLLHTEEGGWSGDLYVIHRRLFSFQNEVAMYLGDSGSAGNQRANVYEVVINSTNGWTQCISLLLGKTPQVSNDGLAKLSMALGHDSLGKGDWNLNNQNFNKNLWLDDLVRMPTLPLK